MKLASPLHRDLVRHVLDLRLWHRRDHLRAHHRRTQRVACHARLGHFLAHHLCEPDDRRLRGAVREHARVAVLAGDGRNVDDPAVLLRAHHRKDGAAHKEDALQVDAEHLVEVGRIDLVGLDASGPGDPSGLHEDIDAAPLLHQRGDRPLAAPHVCHIAAESRHLGAVNAPHELQPRRGERPLVEIEEADARPPRRQFCRDGEA
mmetsp:Transcript_58964/g.135217  ORF Transcript_58964/g.135217 Transcript_58964/m.135217 type:complete len:204 (-) Transcript_58964:64-675(-)